MSQRMIAIVKKIQAHIEAGPPHEELTAATILCSELLGVMCSACRGSGWAPTGHVGDIERCPNGCTDAGGQAAEQEKATTLPLVEAVEVCCILCGAQPGSKCDTALGVMREDQHMIRQLDARRCTDLLEGRLLVDGTRVGL